MRVAWLALAALACTSATLPGEPEPQPGAADAAPTPSWDSPDAATTPPLSPDAALAPDAGASIRELCFAGLGDPSQPLPDYDQFHPVPGSHCMGTNHQDITGIQKVVFLGDSITEGSPPTLPTQYYRARLTEMLEARFGDLEVASCAAWGARTDDLLLPPHQQVQTCFPGVEPLRTLVVMTIGGNDMNAIREDSMGGAPMTETWEQTEAVVTQMSDAIHWLKDDPARFPAGVSVIFSNIYEYTDGEGDLNACPGAILAGIIGSWDAGREPYIHVVEQYMRIATETGSDMLFLLENFCGHGFHAGEAGNECYRGPDAETWFDLTCIHPTPTGHERIAEMFMAVVNE